MLSGESFQDSGVQEHQLSQGQPLQRYIPVIPPLHHGLRVSIAAVKGSFFSLPVRESG